MQKITPFLWFNDQAEEAARYYCSIFKKSKVLDVARYNEAGPGKPGTVMIVKFRLGDQEFTALNGGPQFKFTEAVSFVINCANQREADYYWRKLTAGGGRPSMCGWLKDKYGLSWQVVPTEAIELLQSEDPAKAQRVMAAVMQMGKLDLKTLRKAAAGKPARRS
jgi:predicted 3-demethylubiquinone-9 3-methyltransferase (glyoxalase superfamily)